MSTTTDIAAGLELEPLRLYSAEQTRKVIFGQDVADDVRPTARWLNRQAGLGRIECTKVGRFTYFSADDIRSLIESCAVGLYGRPKNQAKRR